MIARDEQDAIGQVVQAALEDQAVATAYEGDFGITSSGSNPWLVSEGWSR